MLFRTHVDLSTLNNGRFSVANTENVGPLSTRSYKGKTYEWHRKYGYQRRFSQTAPRLWETCGPIFLISLFLDLLFRENLFLNEFSYFFPNTTAKVHQDRPNYNPDNGKERVCRNLHNILKFDSKRRFDNRNNQTDYARRNIICKKKKDENFFPTQK